MSPQPWLDERPSGLVRSSYGPHDVCKKKIKCYFETAYLCFAVPIAFVLFLFFFFKEEGLFVFFRYPPTGKTFGS